MRGVRHLCNLNVLHSLSRVNLLHHVLSFESIYAFTFLGVFKTFDLGLQKIDLTFTFFDLGKGLGVVLLQLLIRVVQCLVALFFF